MIYRVNFKFFLPAVGDRLIQEWQIEGVYERETVPAYDMEGDPVPADVFENATVASIQEWTLGTNDGEIKMIDLPKEVRQNIIDSLFKAGRAMHEKNMERARALAQK